MKTLLLTLTLQSALASQLVGAPSQPRPLPKRHVGSVVIRYGRQRVVSCEASKWHIYRRAPNCKIGRKSVPGSAIIEFIPLPDARREVFGPDKRTRIVVQLRQETQPIERTVALALGPWQVTWKGANKSLQLDVETQDQLVTMSTLFGACISREWHCSLDPSTVTNAIALSALDGAKE